MKKPTPTLKELAAEPLSEPSQEVRQLGAPFPAAQVKAFRVLAAQQDMDVQALLALGINMVFQSYGEPTRIDVHYRRQRGHVKRLKT